MDERDVDDYAKEIRSTKTCSKRWKHLQIIQIHLNLMDKRLGTCTINKYPDVTADKAHKLVTAQKKCAPQVIPDDL